jgi:hypothetical protein
MRIFLKDICLEDIKYLSHFPIQGLVFSITQKNAETIRNIIEKLPFCLTIIGEFNSLPKYEIEELIYFCKLNGIILSDLPDKEEYSCPLIFSPTTSYNVFIQKDEKIITGKINKESLRDNKEVMALILNREELLNYWPLIIEIWSKIKVV